MPEHVQCARSGGEHVVADLWLEQCTNLVLYTGHAGCASRGWRIPLSADIVRGLGIPASASRIPIENRYYHDHRKRPNEKLNSFPGLLQGADEAHYRGL